MPRLHPLLAALLLVPLGIPVSSATGQDDAGSGADAPDAAADALPIPFGRVRGVVAPAQGDVEDWYRLDVPGARGVLLGYHTAAVPSLAVFGGAGQFLRLVPPNALVSLPPGHGALYLQASACANCGNASFAYVIETQVIEPSDLRVSGLVVEEPPLDATPPAWRHVSFLVTNVGTGPSEDYVVRLVATAGGVARASEALFPALAPGEEIRVEMAWDSFGQVGDVLVKVEARPPFDASWPNNHAQATAAVLVGGAGRSVDLLNAQARQTFPGGSAGAVLRYAEGTATLRAEVAAAMGVRAEGEIATDGEDLLVCAGTSPFGACAIWES